MKWSRSTFAFACVVAFAAAGCHEDEIRSSFASEFRCAEERVQIDGIGKNRYRVTGCDKTVIYQCIGQTCIPDREETDDDTHLDPAPVAVQREQPSETMEVARRSQQGGRNLVAVDLRLDKRAILKLRAAPDQFGELVQLKVARVARGDELDGCELAWMINGQRLDAPKAKYVREGIFSVLKTDVPRELVRELGGARQFAIRACDYRWTLRPEQLAEIRHFVELYEEDIAWGRPAAEGTGGLLAPANGWVAWKVDGPHAPPPKGGRVLDTTELFKLLAPSVFRVEATLTTGTSQGSAVAVEPTLLLTNCHVVEGAQKIVVRQEKKEWTAELSRSDPKSDRCVLVVSKASFKPVLGVRQYGDVQVGEPLFTLGSPSGLELTLSNGILSGLREDRGRHFVQTTAPISPGSSGGGLFDAHGYIVGITTKVLVGREHLNQSLNFAIPADYFWEP